jgi:hypothetical protein
MLLSIWKSGELEHATDIDKFDAGKCELFIYGNIEGMMTERLLVLPKNFEAVCMDNRTSKKL